MTVASTRRPPYDPATVGPELAGDGYVVLPAAVERAELARLRREVDAHLALVARGSPAPATTLRHEDGVPFRLENLAASPQLDDSIAAARAHPALLALAGALVGADVVAYGGVLVFKAPGKAPSIELHRDIAEGLFSPDHLWLAVGIYLDDADASNGCLRVVPGSHRLSGAALAERTAEGLTGPACVPVPVPAGSVLLHDARLLHGSPPTSGDRPRRVLYFSYQSAGWMRREGLKRSFRPDDTWLAEALRAVQLGAGARPRLGYDDPVAPWTVPEGWRDAVGAVHPRPDLGVVRYRVTDS